MTRRVQELLRQALELPLEERGWLARELLIRLDTDEPEDPAEMEKAWAEEIARRMCEIEDGTAKMVPWEVVRERLRRRFSG
jgi:putative addiction module component (TIGR02574 family)